MSPAEYFTQSAELKSRGDMFDSKVALIESFEVLNDCCVLESRLKDRGETDAFTWSMVQQMLKTESETLRMLGKYFSR